MSTSVDRTVSLPNDSIGSATGFVSPYIIDIAALAIVSLLIFGDISNVLIRFPGFLIASALALWAALSAKALRRYITDTPRSKIGSAAQGFVELQGRCEFYGNREIQGFLFGPPCVWHRYFIVRLMFGGSNGLRNFGENLSHLPIQVGASDIPFVIRDESGTCIVLPENAKVISSSKRTWLSFGKYYSSKYIGHGARMYVIGEMRSEGCALTSYNENAQVAGLLSTWKKDQSWLLGEFDVDQNGELDQDEWGSAVKRAKKISREIYDQKKDDRIDNVIRKPANGLPMLISDRHPDELAIKFARLGYFNLVIAAGCAVAACYQFI